MRENGISAWEVCAEMRILRLHWSMWTKDVPDLNYNFRCACQSSFSIILEQRNEKTLMNNWRDTLRFKICFWLQGVLKSHGIKFFFKTMDSGKYWKYWYESFLCLSAPKRGFQPDLISAGELSTNWCRLQMIWSWGSKGGQRIIFTAITRYLSTWSVHPLPSQILTYAVKVPTLSVIGSLRTHLYFRLWAGLWR